MVLFLVRFSASPGALTIRPSGTLAVGNAQDAIPVRVSASAEFEARLQDLREAFPYMNKDVAKELGMSPNRVRYATLALGLQSDGNYCYHFKYGQTDIKVYSEEALILLRRVKEQFPHFSRLLRPK